MPPPTESEAGPKPAFRFYDDCLYRKYHPPLNYLYLTSGLIGSCIESDAELGRTITVGLYTNGHDVAEPPSQKRFMGQLSETFFESRAQYLSSTPKFAIAARRFAAQDGVD